MSPLLRALLLSACLWQPLGALALTPPPLLLAMQDDGRADVAAYLVSEKLDGVRAYWDGARLYFRSGREIQAPDWFTAALPKRPLDGELWLGYGQFDRLSAIVRREQPDDAEWRQVRYQIFELPGAPGSFAERVALMAHLVAEVNQPWFGQISQFSVVDRKSLQNALDQVVARGGEGLMLHRADAAYVAGRNEVLRKFKPWQDDEATVVAHRPGKGRLAGQLGALRLRLADGREFNLGSGFTDQDRQQPPPLGSLITFRYRGLTASGLPRFASFWRVRED